MSPVPLIQCSGLSDEVHSAARKLTGISLFYSVILGVKIYYPNHLNNRPNTYAGVLRIYEPEPVYHRRSSTTLVYNACTMDASQP